MPLALSARPRRASQYPQGRFGHRRYHRCRRRYASLAPRLCALCQGCAALVLVLSYPLPFGSLSKILVRLHLSPVCFPCILRLQSFLLCFTNWMIDNSCCFCLMASCTSSCMSSGCACRYALTSCPIVSVSMP